MIKISASSKSFVKNIGYGHFQQRKAELIEKSFKPITMEQYNAEINQAMEDSKNERMRKATDLKAKQATMFPKYHN